MAVTDVSTINQKLIAISFLPESAAAAPKAAWETRFLPSDAFWVQVDRGADANTIVQEIFRVIQGQNYEDANIVGQNFSMAAFYDISDDKSPEQASTFLRIPALLRNSLGVTVHHLLQFGYLGMLPLSGTEKLRGNCRGILDREKPEKLFLIAERPLTKTGGHVWKAVALLMDVVRRDSTLIMPSTPYNVGYLKYLEHDEELLTDAKARLDQISIMLSDTAGSLFEKMSDHLEGMTAEAKKTFVPKAALQPLHPDMTPSRPLFGRAAWDQAHGLSTEAVSKTGEGLVKRVQEHFRLSQTDAGESLYALLQEAEAGCAFDLETALLQVRGGLHDVRAPHFLGSKGAITAESIQEYLNNSRDYGIYLAKCERLDSFIAAVGEMRRRMEAKRISLENEKNVTQKRLDNLPTRRQFLDTVTGTSQPSGGVSMESSFSVLVGNLSQVRMLLCRQKNDKERIENNFIAGTLQYYINEHTGGLFSMDAAELKAVHVMLYQYGDGAGSDILGQLIPGEE